MICRKVTYKNFRNIEYAVFEPSETVTVLNGANGQGKTNTLEGIFMFAGGKSFRTAHEENLIRFSGEISEISMIYYDGRRENTIDLKWVRSSGKRFCKKNGVPITKLSELVGSFRAVLFCPEHLSIVSGGPAIRRKFLDSAISQTDSLYLKALQRYSQLLEQRNASIKLSRERRDDRIFLSTCEVWASQMAELAEMISEKRSVYTESLSEKVSGIISDMTGGKESTLLEYQTKKSRDEYYRLLTENTERELRSGITLYGVHKDDIKIELCGKDARLFASQGQQRSIALAMKIAEGEISKEEKGQYPVFLFDDILSELDSDRRNYLLKSTKDRQVIITSCDKIEQQARIYDVCGGELKLREEEK